MCTTAATAGSTRLPPLPLRGGLPFPCAIDSRSPFNCPRSPVWTCTCTLPPQQSKPNKAACAMAADKVPVSVVTGFLGSGEAAAARKAQPEALVHLPFADVSPLPWVPCRVCAPLNSAGRRCIAALVDRCPANCYTTAAAAAAPARCRSSCVRLPRLRCTLAVQTVVSC